MEIFSLDVYNGLNSCSYIYWPLHFSMVLLGRVNIFILISKSWNGPVAWKSVRVASAFFYQSGWQKQRAVALLYGSAVLFFFTLRKDWSCFFHNQIPRLNDFYVYIFIDKCCNRRGCQFYLFTKISGDGQLLTEFYLAFSEQYWICHRKNNAFLKRVKENLF